VSLLESWRRQLQRERDKLADTQKHIAQLEKKIAAAERRGKG
jgi:hypothetical protein